MAQKVSEIMTPGPVALPVTAPLSEAARIMRDQGIGDVLVTEAGQLVGVATDRDIVIRGLAEARDPNLTSVGEVCSADPVTVAPGDETSSAVRLMRQHAIRRLPVVESGRPVGVISIGDLAMERDETSALSDISAAPPQL